MLRTTCQCSSWGAKSWTASIPRSSASGTRTRSTSRRSAGRRAASARWPMRSWRRRTRWSRSPRPSRPSWRPRSQTRTTRASMGRAVLEGGAGACARPGGGTARQETPPPTPRTRPTPATIGSLSRRNAARSPMSSRCVLEGSSAMTIIQVSPSPAAHGAPDLPRRARRPRHPLRRHVLFSPRVPEVSASAPWPVSLPPPGLA
mmetsp:Transcript_21792/g.57589  ORF Transcript_21792/g.57589 Transcript_21792/m.57589 type:complete len:203 (+) Transcript_21792:535-1143(+)